MDGEVVKREVRIAFDYAYKEEDWVYPLADTLAGVTAQEAVWKPVLDVNCIWAIVLHMAVWTENIIERMTSGERAHPTEGAWPSLPPALDEAAWQSAQRRLWDSLAALRAYMEAAPPDGLMAGPYGMADLLCRYIHLGYHIGQITVLRAWQAAPERVAS